MKFKIPFILFSFCMLFCFTLPQSQAQNGSFPELMAFLNSEYSSPFQMVGKVKEISKNRLIFTKTDIHLKRGTLLWVCEYKPEIPPPLQSQTALIKVEAIYKNMVIAEILENGKKAIKPNDTVLTPPPPTIHLYTNIKAKQSNKVYQNLITSLLAQEMQIQEISKDIFNEQPDDSDLLLRLEWESGQLICQCTLARGNRLLFSTTMDHAETIETLYSSGHWLKSYDSRPAIISHKPSPAIKKEVVNISPTATTATTVTVPAPVPGPVPTTVTPPATTPLQPPLPATAQAPNTATTIAVTAPGVAQFSAAATAPASDQQNVHSNFQKAKVLDQTEFHRFSKLYHRIITCDPDADGNRELALLGNNEIALYRLEQGHMTPVVSYQFPDKNLIPIHLHSAEIDKIPGDELLITLSKETNELDKKDSELCSMILTLKNQELKPLANNLPYYLRTIEDRQGTPVALAQKKGRYEQFSGPILELQWNNENHNITAKKSYDPARGIYSIYQFNLKPDDDLRVLIIETGDALHGYFTPEERLEATGPRNYGKFQELAYPVKLENDKILGGFDKKTYKEIFTPRRFIQKSLFDNQSFTIYKERKDQTGIVDRAVQMVWNKTQGMDQVTGLKWVGKQIVETWQSKKISKNILDFTFIQNPHRILVLYREETGCAIEAL